MVEATRAMIPPKIHALMEPTFLVGHSPHFVGLHSANPADLGPSYAGAVAGWTYDDMAHAVYEEQVIVFPRPDLYEGVEVGTLLHEFGHLFDHVTGFNLDAPVTTAYSRTDRAERVAEAFGMILRPPSGAWQDYVAAESFRPMREAIGVA